MKKQKKDFIRRVFRLCGYIIYSEKRILIDEEKKVKCSSSILAMRKFFLLFLHKFIIHFCDCTVNEKKIPK